MYEKVYRDGSSGNLPYVGHRHVVDLPADLLDFVGRQIDQVVDPLSHFDQQHVSKMFQQVAEQFLHVVAAGVDFIQDVQQQGDLPAENRAGNA